MNPFDIIKDEYNGAKAGIQEYLDSKNNGQGTISSMNDGLQRRDDSINQARFEREQNKKMSSENLESYFRELTDTSFVGIDTNNIDAVSSAITTLQDEIKGIVDGFQPDTSLENAIRGKVSEALRDYLNEVKSLLNAYIEVLDINKTELKTAVSKYEENANKNAETVTNAQTDISSNASSLRKMASDVHLN